MRASWGDPGGCLLRGKRSRKKGTGGHRKHSRAKSALKSISTRPESIAERKDFGHWEIDSVVGGKRKGKHALLTLVERYTRYVLIRKLPDGSSKSIVKELCKLGKNPWAVRSLGKHLRQSHAIMAVNLWILKVWSTPA